MKRIFSTSILALGLSIGAVAQEEASVPTPGRFGFGVRMGFGTTFLDGEEAFDETEKIFNLHVGAAATYDLAPNFDLESGLYYTKKGYYYEPSKGSEVTCNLYYLQLPLMVGYKVLSSNSVELALKAGPYVAYGINGKTKEKMSVETTTTKTDGNGNMEIVKKNEEVTNDFDSFDHFKRFDAGAKAALNCTIKKSFLVGVTYEHGFANISESESEAFNKTIALTLGFNF